MPWRSTIPFPSTFTRRSSIILRPAGQPEYAGSVQAAFRGLKESKPDAGRNGICSCSGRQFNL